MRWIASLDCFAFDGVTIPKDLCVTKRVILSFIARLFDPIGFATPFVMVAKCLFQDVWRLGLDWDEFVPTEYQEVFTGWIEGLECLRSWRIPRSYTGVSWKSAFSFHVHVFGDASERAYGACAYLTVGFEDDTVTSSLVLARARVAPLKKISLPRLELLGSLMAARLLVFVRKELRLPEDVQYSCWTDSTVALAWIQSDPHRWKPFVSNRVSEIQALSSPSCWHHCPGSQNPADLVTRGISASELVQSKLWLCGPTFLVGQTMVSSIVQEVGKAVSVLERDTDFSQEVCEEESASKALVVMEKPDSFLDVERWGSFLKAMRVVGWLLRFIHNVRIPSHSGGAELTFAELCRAKVVLLHSVQVQHYLQELEALTNGRSVPKSSSIFRLNPFIGEDGLLRVQGRLQFSELTEAEKFPIIIPKGHVGLLLARHIHVTQKHAGVNSMLVRLRDQYWIVGARCICKRVKRQCVSCQRQDVGGGVQSMAPLPDVRVKRSPPFSVVGIDHGGPLYCCDYAGAKFYVLLFTCAVIRAVHLELVHSLSSGATLLAIRRFIARRGMPSVIMSDNAKGFKAASLQLLHEFGPDGPEWRFIAPRAPWWGGWWERLMGVVKSALRKSVGNRSLTRVELETSLHEVEGCVNSRPLTFTGDVPKSGEPLTPSHFLTGRTLGSKVLVDHEVPKVDSVDLTQRVEYQSQILERFWSIWLNEYLRSLPPYRGPRVESNLGKGSVVLIRDDDCKRLQWPLGVIQNTIPGRDGLIRTVEVKTARGVFVRPIQRIHLLELSDGAQTDLMSKDVSSQSDMTEVLTEGQNEGIQSEIQDSQHISTADLEPNHRVSSYGRTIKPVNKLNL